MEKIITLKPFEILIANHEGQRTYTRKFNESHESEACKKGPQKYIDGFAAELAFCQLINIYPRLLFGDKDEKPDGILGDLEIDVKCTDLINGQLMVMEKCIHRPCNIYVLMYGTLVKSAAFKYIGYAFKNSLYKPENLRDFDKPSKAYVLNQKNLIPILPDKKWRK